MFFCFVFHVQNKLADLQSNHSRGVSRSAHLSQVKLEPWQKCNVTIWRKPSREDKSYAGKYDKMLPGIFYPLFASLLLVTPCLKSTPCRATQLSQVKWGFEEPQKDLWRRQNYISKIPDSRLLYSLHSLYGWWVTVGIDQVIKYDSLPGRTRHIKLHSPLSC